MPSSMRNVACASVLVDAGQGEADVDKDPVARPGCLVGEQRYIYPPPGSADVDPGVLSVNTVELGYEPRDPEAHDASS